MPKKKKKAKAVARSSHEPQDLHSYQRGKSLGSIAIGVLLISFGFGYINLEMLALVAGAIYALKGVVRMMSRGC